MKLSLTKKMISCLLSAFILINPIALHAQEAGTSGVFDDTLKDLSVVGGAGVAGAILGLSTLSFVEKPKDHLKNIAIGGAIGIVLGVGIVIFSQATKSQSSIMASNDTISPENASKLNLKEFTEEKIAAHYMKEPTIDLDITF